MLTRLTDALQTGSTEVYKGTHLQALLATRLKVVRHQDKKKGGALINFAINDSGSVLPSNGRVLARLLFETRELVYR